MYKITEAEFIMVLEKKKYSSLDSIYEAVGYPHILNLLKLFGGQAIYIPTLDDICIAPRNERICQAANNGSTYKELAVEYGLSERSIRKIVTGI